MRTYKVYIYRVLFGKVIGKKLVYEGPSHVFAIGCIIGSNHGGEVHVYEYGRRIIHRTVKARWVDGRLVW